MSMIRRELPRSNGVSHDVLLVSEIVAVEDSPFEYRSPRPTARLHLLLSYPFTR
jgi:hypothetical protein